MRTFLKYFATFLAGAFVSAIGGWLIVAGFGAPQSGWSGTHSLSYFLTIRPTFPPEPPESEQEFAREVEDNVILMTNETFLTSVTEDPAFKRTHWAVAHPDPREWPSALIRHTHVKAIPGTRLLELNVDLPASPEDAKEVTSVLVDCYLKQSAEHWTNALKDKRAGCLLIKNRLQAELRNELDEFTTNEQTLTGPESTQPSDQKDRLLRVEYDHRLREEIDMLYRELWDRGKQLDEIEFEMEQPNPGRLSIVAH